MTTHTHTAHGFSVDFEIEQEFDSSYSSRTWDNFGTIMMTDDLPYGDDTGDGDEILEILNDEKLYVSLPVYAYVHSGTTIATTPFNDRWDSGLAGVIYVELSNPEFTTKEKALEILQSEVDVLNQEVTGDVWYYNIEDGDSCGGLYGYNYALKEAIDAADSQCLKMKKESDKKAADLEASYKGLFHA